MHHSLSLADSSIAIHQLLIFWNQVLNYPHFSPSGVFLTQPLWSGPRKCVKGIGQRAPTWLSTCQSSFYTCIFLPLDVVVTRRGWTAVIGLKGTRTSDAVAVFFLAHVRNPSWEFWVGGETGNQHSSPCAPAFPLVCCCCYCYWKIR